MTTESDRQILLRLAREAIAAHVGNLPAPAPAMSGVLARPGGVFVTLHTHGDLRGCIGHVEAHDPIGRVLQRCAVAACSSDPRFLPLKSSEIAHLVVEISLLGPLEPIEGPADIEIGRHGLVLERRWQRGLLLPQVATQWHWDAETFLAQTCHKAGLPSDAWKDGTTIWRFEAEVFGEPQGPSVS